MQTRPKASLMIITACLGYAVVRYNLVGTVPWEQFPVFIVNKATAMASVIFLALKVRAITMGDAEAKTAWGKSFGTTLLLHLLLSLGILSPEYFARFYTDGKLSLTGGLMLMAGATSAVAFWVNKGQVSFSGILSGSALSLLLLHTTMVGWQTWPKPAEWPGYLLPISMISAMIVIYAIHLYLRIKGRER